MRVLVTGGVGVLGRTLLPLLETAGHEISAPGPQQLDLLDAGQVGAAIACVQGVYHLATRIPPPDRTGDREAWRENDRLRADASRLLVNAALAAPVDVYVVPTVTFVYPDGDVDESTPLRDVPANLESALAAEREAARFTASGRRRVVLRFGLLDGASTGNERPNRRYGATIHVEDAGAHCSPRSPLQAMSTTLSATASGSRMPVSSKLAPELLRLLERRENSNEPITSGPLSRRSWSAELISARLRECSGMSPSGVRSRARIAWVTPRPESPASREGRRRVPSRLQLAASPSRP